MTEFYALPGFYQVLFLYLEPISTVAPAIIVWAVYGESWFHHQFIPSTNPPPVELLDSRTTMAIWQLANTYLLMGLISSLVFRAARDALSNDRVAQERIVGALLAALAIADLTHIAATVVGLPPDLRYNPAAWNGMTHGNITTVVILFAVRVSWFLGIGRTPYYYGQQTQKVSKEE